MAATKTDSASGITYPQLRQAIAARRLMPIYLLHGEEGYYIDELVKMFESLLPEEERDFNLYTLYGPETGVDTIMDVCQRLPMMAERQVVIVKEAQVIRSDSLNKLHHYALRPNQSTVLVIACRGDKAKGKELLAAIKQNGVIFESKKVSERNILPVISDLIKEKHMTVDPKSLSMLRDYIGTDLARLYNEIDKLSFILGPGAMITPEAIERNIGVSREYNSFELVDAIAARDPRRVFRILAYFKSNPKAVPLVMATASIFNFFTDLLVAYYTPDRSDAGLMAALGCKPFALKRIKLGMSRYNALQIVEIIGAIRDFDVKSKGVGSRQNEHELFHQLAYHILSAPGRV